MNALWRATICQHIYYQVMRMFSLNFVISPHFIEENNSWLKWLCNYLLSAQIYRQFSLTDLFFGDHFNDPFCKNSGIVSYFCVALYQCRKANLHDVMFAFEYRMLLLNSQNVENPWKFKLLFNMVLTVWNFKLFPNRTKYFALFSSIECKLCRVNILQMGNFWTEQTKMTYQLCSSVYRLEFYFCVASRWF